MPPVANLALCLTWGASADAVQSRLRRGPSSSRGSRRGRHWARRDRAPEEWRARPPCSPRERRRARHRQERSSPRRAGYTRHKIARCCRPARSRPPHRRRSSSRATAVGEHSVDHRSQIATRPLPPQGEARSHLAVDRIVAEVIDRSSDVSPPGPARCPTGEVLARSAGCRSR